jgi:hypothetical protein
MSHSMTGFPGGQELPENVRKLKPANVVVEFQPTNAQIMTMLIEMNARLTHMESLLTENSTDISTTKQAIVFITEQVEPTLKMLTEGPIGQILGIGPKPEPRSRRHR